jgi:hypothetical protein
LATGKTGVSARRQGLPRPLHTPLVPFLTTSAACSVPDRAGLLHPAADPGFTRFHCCRGFGVRVSRRSTASPLSVTSSARSSARSTLQSLPPAHSLPALQAAMPPGLPLTPDLTASPTRALTLASSAFTAGPSLSSLLSRLSIPRGRRSFRVGVRWSVQRHHPTSGLYAMGRSVAPPKRFRSDCARCSPGLLRPPLPARVAVIRRGHQGDLTSLRQRRRQLQHRHKAGVCGVCRRHLSCAGHAAILSIAAGIRHCIKQGRAVFVTSKSTSWKRCASR